MTPYYDNDGVTLYCGDAAKVMPQLPASSYQMLFTSPPYLTKRTYGGDVKSTCVSDVVRLADSGAQVLVNLGIVTRNRNVIRYWDSLLDVMESDGWRLPGWYVWDKTSGLPGRSSGQLMPSHEWIFHFAKQVRLPNKITPNKSAGKRQPPFGGIRSGTHDRASDLGRNNAYTVPSHRVPDSVIRVKNSNNHRVDHPAVMPLGLADQSIRSFTDRGDTILDPFAGAGTTLLAAQLAGRKAIGVELNESYCQMIKNRLKKYGKPT